MVCDRPQLTASVWTLLKSINARFLIPYRPHVQTLPEIMDSGGMSSTTVDGVVRHDANACEGVSENATLILDCWHTAQRFGTVLYRIVSRYFVQYRIVSIVFPHSHIVPSLVLTFHDNNGLCLTVFGLHKVTVVSVRSYGIRMEYTDLCPCGEKQTMSHTVDSCRLTKLNGGFSQLHSADDEATAWLTNYGSWCIRKKKKR